MRKLFAANCGVEAAVGRAYAGILGQVAFALVALRGAAAGWGVEATLLAASLALFLFAGIGYLIGQTAEQLVRDSVEQQLAAALAAWERQSPATKSAAAP